MPHWRNFRRRPRLIPSFLSVHFNLGLTYLKKQDFRGPAMNSEGRIGGGSQYRHERRAAREKQMENGTVPSPELLQDPQ
jgi:hypothetical protein